MVILMEKITVGLPKGIYYYYYGDMLKYFFNNLGINIVISPDTNREIIDEGIKYSNDEMCYSLKILLGHVSYLKDKCDYLIVPRINNFGKKDQTCTNFLSFYDLIKNIFNIKIIDFNIDYLNLETEVKAFIQMARKLGVNKKRSLKAYKVALEKSEKKLRKEIFKNMDKLNSPKTKLLIVAHPYNIYDRYIGKPITTFLEKMDVEIIYADKFNPKITNKLSTCYSKQLYWKYNKEIIGSIKLVSNQINGIIFLSAFPCGPDSLVNELVIRKLDLPTLNLVIDDNDSLTGIETRLESFVDIIEQK